MPLIPPRFARILAISAALICGNANALPPEHIAYGPLPQQFGVLHLPGGNGPYPVIALFHGGCWQHHIATYQHTEPLAIKLAEHGWAVWNLEYRGTDEVGGGWPGTFQDSAAALDYLRVVAKKYPLDMTRVSFMGHSAGGHLAIWAANRAQLPVQSKLYNAHPLLPQHVIGLGAITDLQGYIDEGSSCSGGASPLLAGAVEAEVSPLQMPAGHVSTTLITAQEDNIVPLSQAQDYASKAGTSVRVVPVPGDHFGLVYPAGPPFEQILQVLRN